VTIPAEIGCRHDTGCADGCYVVHRHNNQEMSRAELKALSKEKNEERKAAKAAKAAEELAAVAESAPVESVSATGAKVTAVDTAQVEEAA
jgi:hypothetical protein